MLEEQGLNINMLIKRIKEYELKDFFEKGFIKESKF